VGWPVRPACSSRSRRGADSGLLAVGGPELGGVVLAFTRVGVGVGVCVGVGVGVRVERDLVGVLTQQQRSFDLGIEWWLGAHSAGRADHDDDEREEREPDDGNERDCTSTNCEDAHRCRITGCPRRPRKRPQVQARR